MRLPQILRTTIKCLIFLLQISSLGDVSLIKYHIIFIYCISHFLQFFFRQGFSCVDLQNAGMRQSGVYYLQIRGTTYWFLKVYCEQDIADGGWTVSNSHSVMLENWYLLLFFSLNRCFMRECVCVYVSDEVIT